MKIAFKSENGSCPKWEHDNIVYFLYEDTDGTWTLKSQKKGCRRKTHFYKKGSFKVYPTELLKRFFKNKKNVKERHSDNYHFYYWNGMIFATDGKEISVHYVDIWERPSFNSYLECLHDAKEYLSQKYSDRQISLFD